MNAATSERGRQAAPLSQAWVALLRGVNVGKANRIPMADLRALLERHHYTGVGTLLNSGNAVFRAMRGTAAHHAATIASALSTELSLDVPVIVMSCDDMREIVSENPLGDAPDPARVLVVFAQDAGSLAALATLDTLVMPPERFIIGSKAAYLHCAGGILESKVAAALLGRAGKAVTTRNLSTVIKLQKMLECA